MNEFLQIDRVIRDFIRQQDRPTLVLSCRSEDLVVPAKLLQAQAQQRSEAILLAVASCSSVGDWLSELAGRLSADLGAANTMLVQEGLAPWSELPIDAVDTRLDAAQRLESMIRHCGNMSSADSPIVWALIPVDCTDLEGYLQAVRPLTVYQDWMRGHRFILWDDARDPALVPEMLEQDNQDSLVLDFDFSPERVLDRMVKRIQDPALGHEERKDVVFQLAAVDYAYKRYDEALNKYRWVFAQDQDTNVTRQALCLQGAGDVAMRLESYEQGLAYFRSALAKALSEEKPQPSLLYQILMNAGQACFELGDFHNAEGYFEYGNQAAAKSMNPFAKADALEKRGYAQQKAGEQGSSKKLRESLESFCACRALCCEFGYEARWQKVLEREIEIFTHYGLRKEASVARRQLASGFERAQEEHERNKPAPNPAKDEHAHRA